MAIEFARGTAILPRVPGQFIHMEFQAFWRSSRRHSVSLRLIRLSPQSGAFALSKPCALQHRLTQRQRALHVRVIKRLAPESYLRPGHRDFGA